MKRLALLLTLLCASPAQSQSDRLYSDHQIAERGQDFAVYRKITPTTDTTGNASTQTNQFTLLENALHYRDANTGAWRESEDLIESFAEGAVARRGPHQAIFSHDLNSQAVFDILPADGKRIQGGVRGIQLTDTSNGRTITLGTVKNSVTGQLLPPNSLLWADAFDGLKADVVIHWKHNLWSHDVLLREQPELPLGWDAAHTRLEVLTEFIVDAEPTLRKDPGPDPQVEATDDVLIDFGAQVMVVGKAFPVAGNAALNLSGGLREEGAPVRKQWKRADDGRHFLIESLAWNDASPSMRDLPVRRHANASPTTGPQRSFARAWPQTPPALKKRQPIQLASADYQQRGYLIDFTTVSGSTSSAVTLSSGQTYYIKTSYQPGGSLTVQAGAIVKFKTNAYLMFYGNSLTFPSSGAKAVFTSRNDDSVGDRIAGVSGESDSDGDPSTHLANPSFLMYYITFNATVQNARFRWAKIGVKNDGNTATRTVSNCFFEHITASGSSGISNTNPYLTATNLKYCKVTTLGATMALDCIGIENDWAGDSGWALTSPATAGWPTSSGSTTPEIEGFASATSVNAGSSIDLYVDVRHSSDTTYTMQIYRMGWYNAAGARKMTWYDSTSGASVNSLSKTSVKQAVPAIDNTTGVIDCLATTVNGSAQTPWSLSYALAVPSWWLSGVYLVKLTGSTTGKQSYLIFTVREDSRASDLFMQQSVTTWQAYNPWGGRSLYRYPNRSTCSSNSCNSCQQATKVSFNRPYAGATCNASELAYANGAGEFLAQISYDAAPGWEYNALRWIEKQGFDVTYCTDVDTHENSLAGKSIKVFLSVGHDEYWSQDMRTNVEAARDRTTNPINLMFLASNVCFWKIDFDSGLRAFNCNKVGDYDQWRNDDYLNSHESSLIGVEHVHNSLWNVAMTVTHPSGGHWAYDYTGIAAGQSHSLAGLLGYEVDGTWVGTPCTPCDNCAQVRTGSGSYDTIKLADSNFSVGACSSGHSYMTIYRATEGPTTGAPNSHAQVFATGSMQWSWGLDDYGYAGGWMGPCKMSPVAKQITDNVIRKFTGMSTRQLTNDNPCP